MTTAAEREVGIPLSLLVALSLAEGLLVGRKKALGIELVNVVAPSALRPVRNAGGDLDVHAALEEVRPAAAVARLAYPWWCVACSRYNSPDAASRGSSSPAGALGLELADVHSCRRCVGATHLDEGQNFLAEPLDERRARKDITNHPVHGRRRVGRAHDRQHNFRHADLAVCKTELAQHAGTVPGQTRHGRIMHIVLGLVEITKRGLDVIAGQVPLSNGERGKGRVKKWGRSFSKFLAGMSVYTSSASTQLSPYHRDSIRLGSFSKGFSLPNNVFSVADEMISLSQR